MIAWNNAELLARVEATLEQYKGVTYDDSQIATAKADRAQLNAFCKALNDERNIYPSGCQGFFRRTGKGAPTARPSRTMKRRLKAVK